MIAPINLLTVTDSEQILINNDAWADIEFEVALDSGAVVHVCAPAAAQATLWKSRRGAAEARSSLWEMGELYPTWARSA